MTLGFRGPRGYRVGTYDCQIRPLIETGVGDLTLVIMQRVVRKINPHFRYHVVASPDAPKVPQAGRVLEGSGEVPSQLFG